jgi:serine/threonine protein kinase
MPVTKHTDAFRFDVKLRPGQRLQAESLALENLEYLGSGGNGSVFRMIIAEGALRGLIVAVKFLETIGEEERVKRFEQEIKILREVNHPHVIKVLDVGRYTAGSRSVPFFVMEYQPRNLERETNSHPRGIHPDAFFPLCLQMTSALIHIHAKDVSHRDLKPANILFDGTNIKIADFGIASLLDRSALVKSAKGKKVGPHFYMSPEQWAWWKEESSEPPGKKSDIFQLGLIFIRMLTGFNPNTVHQWEKDTTRPTPRSKMRIYDGSLVNAISGIVEEMLEVEAAQRPSAEDVQDRLLNAFRGYSSHFTALYGVRPGREF